MRYNWIKDRTEQGDLVLLVLGILGTWSWKPRIHVKTIIKIKNIYIENIFFSPVLQSFVLSIHGMRSKHRLKNDSSPMVKTWRKWDKNAAERIVFSLISHTVSFSQILKQRVFV